MKTVYAEEIISYECICPECNEIQYSDIKDDWDIHEMIHTEQKIKCNGCGSEFYVTV